MRIRWFIQAVDDLEHLRRYIAKDNPRAAHAVAVRIRDAVEQLATHPSMGRPGRVPGTRELIIPGTPCIVPYRIREDSIEVLRVMHMARKWPKTF